MNYKNKYVIYKNKYIQLKNQKAGVYLGTRSDGSSIDLPDLMFYHETAKHWSLKEALKFSHVSQDTKKFVAEMPWDFYNYSIPNDMTLNVFNRIFPNAIGINISNLGKITDADFIYLRLIKKLNMSDCYQLTDAVFTHLTNLTTLDISYCNQLTDAAFTHLTN